MALSEKKNINFSSRSGVSVVIPVRNEGKNILVLLTCLREIFIREGMSGEVIFVDDGSTDGSLDGIAENIKPAGTLNARVIRLERNMGQSLATIAGLESADNDIIVTMDGDLQFDPGDLPNILSIAKDYHMVCGIRYKRQDSKYRILCSRIANIFRNLVTGDNISDAGCCFRAYRKEYVSGLAYFDSKLFRKGFLFFPLLIRLQGYSVAQIRVSHYPRIAGSSKYHPVRGRFLSGILACFMVLWIRINWKHYLRESKV